MHPAQVSGGGLPGTFALAQVHFHWGARDDSGSEHTLDGAPRPIEAHLVHFNTKYGATLKEALVSSRGLQPDALAVVGFFLQVAEEDNPALDPIVRGLADVPSPGNTTVLTPTPEGAALFSPAFVHQAAFEGGFFRYAGSLTTPGCNEIVSWIVVKVAKTNERKRF